MGMLQHVWDYWSYWTDNSDDSDTELDLDWLHCDTADIILKSDDSDTFVVIQIDCRWHCFFWTGWKSKAKKLPATHAVCIELLSKQKIIIVF